MTDFRDLDRDQQNNVIRQLMTNGEYSKLGEEVEAGELCAYCLMPAHVCLCSHDDDD